MSNLRFAGLVAITCVELLSGVEWADAFLFPKAGVRIGQGLLPGAFRFNSRAVSKLHNRKQLSTYAAKSVSPKMMMWGFLPPHNADLPEPNTIVEFSKEEELESLLMQGSMLSKLVVVDWYASWCRTCFFLEPKFKKLAKELEDTCIFAKADALLVEYNDGKGGPGSLKSRLGITKYPTFQVFKDRTLVGELGGDEDLEAKAFEDQLRRLLVQARAAPSPAQPLRVTGVGATRRIYDAAAGGGGGGGGGRLGGGGSGRGSAGGGASRSFE